MPGTHIYKGKFLRTNPDGIQENNLSYKNNKKTSKDLKNLTQKEKDEILLKGLLMEAGTIPRDEEIIKQRILIKNPNYVSYEEVKNEEVEDFLTKYGIIPKKEEETSPLPMGEGLGVRANKEQNIGGTTFTEEEWNKRQDNIKKKEEIIEKVKREREENNGKLKNSEYNNEEEEKEGQDKESKETTLSNNPEKVSSKTRKEYEEFINDKSNYIWANGVLVGTLGLSETFNLIIDIGEKLGKMTDFFGTDEWEEKIGQKNVKMSTKFLAKFMYGDGSPEYFGNNHWVSKKIKNSSLYEDAIRKVKDDIRRNPEKYKEGGPGYTKIEPYSGLTHNIDFGYSLGTGHYKLEAIINEKGNIIIDFKITDRYDFHYDASSNPGNRAGVYYEANGYGKPFDVEINIVDEIPYFYKL